MSFMQKQSHLCDYALLLNSIVCACVRCDTGVYASVNEEEYAAVRENPSWVFASQAVDELSCCLQGCHSDGRATDEVVADLSQLQLQHIICE